MFSQSSSSVYDVFISYSHHNEDWVIRWLLPKLRVAGLSVCVDKECFEPGAPSLTEMERAVLTSRKTVIVLTPDYLRSEWAEFENILAQTLDPAARRRRLIPLMLERCELPLRVRALTYLDFTWPQEQEGQLKRLIRACQRADRSESAVQQLPTESLVLPLAQASPLQQLASEIGGLLNAMGYAKSQLVESDSYVEFLAEKSKDGRTVRRWIRCMAKSIGILDVDSAASRIGSGGDTEVWLVISRRALVSEAAVERMLELPNIYILSLAEFYNRMLNIRPYLERIIAEYNADHISREYIPLSCQVPRYDGTRSRIIDMDSFSSIDDYVDTWLDVSGQNHLSILGDFGTGKTWFCRHYAYQLAVRYLADPERNRIPVLVPLRQYAQSPRLEEMVVDILEETYGVQLEGSYDAFLHLNRYGRSLLLLDGFDEMKQMVDYDVMVRNFEELSRVVEPSTPCKVVLTSRTAYFRSNIDVQQILEGDRIIELRARPNFHIIYLKELSEEQIQAILRKRVPTDWGQHYEFVQTTYDLPNLARRPVLLDIIISTLPDMRGLDHVNHAVLYQLYTDRWIEGNIAEHRTLMGAQDKRLFMQELAWQMFATGKLRLHFSEFPEQVRRYFGFPQSKLVDYLAHDLRSQSFLIRDSEGNYEFAHRSFIEYFVSAKLSDEVTHGEYSDFMQHRLPPEVIDFMRELLSPASVQVLWEWISRTRSSSFDDCRYLGSNALTLLHAMDVKIAEADLSDTILVGADLASADLTDVNFAGADLTYVVFNGAILRNADCSGAVMDGVRIDDAGSLVCLAFSPAGRWIATGHSDSRITIWDLSDNSTQVLSAHSGSVTSLAFRADGKYLASASDDFSVIIWETQGWQQFLTKKGHLGSLTRVEWGPVKNQLATAARDGRIYIWDLYRNYPLLPIELKDDVAKCLCFSPDGLELFAGTRRGQLLGWNVETGAPTFACQLGPQSYILGVCHSPSAPSLVTGSKDSCIRVWSRDDATQYKTLEGHSDWVDCVSFHPSGNFLVSASSDNSVIVWDARIWRPIRVFRSHSDFVQGAYYSSDGELVASASWNGQIYLWKAATGEIIADKTLPHSRSDWTGASLRGVKGLMAGHTEYLMNRGAITS